MISWRVKILLFCCSAISSLCVFQPVWRMIATHWQGWYLEVSHSASSHICWPEPTHLATDICKEHWGQEERGDRCWGTTSNLLWEERLETWIFNKDAIVAAQVRKYDVLEQDCISGHKEEREGLISPWGRMNKSLFTWMWGVRGWEWLRMNFFVHFWLWGGERKSVIGLTKLFFLILGWVRLQSVYKSMDRTIEMGRWMVWEKGGQLMAIWRW